MVDIKEFKCEKVTVNDFYKVKVRFTGKINLEELAIRNKNVEYNPGGKFAGAVLNCEKLGRVQIFPDKAYIFHLNKDLATKINMKDLRDYLLEVINGEKRGFMAWLEKQDRILIRDLKGE